MNDDTTAAQLAEIEELIREHQQKQRYSQGFGSPAERVKSILRECCTELAVLSGLISASRSGTQTFVEPCDGRCAILHRSA